MIKAVISFELFKLLRRRTFVTVILCMTALLPALVALSSYIQATAEDVVEGSFLDQMAWATISFTRTFIAFPVVIILFTAQELNNGHASRVVVVKSRTFYFLAKLFYCFFCSAYFSIVGLLTLAISVRLSPLHSLDLDPAFAIEFMLQLFLTTFTLSLLLLSFTLVIRKTAGCFFFYFILDLSERLIFSLRNAPDFHLLPVHSTRLFYSPSGQSSVNTYHRLFESEFAGMYWLPFLLCLFFLMIAYFNFQQRGLKVLSD